MDIAVNERERHECFAAVKFGEDDHVAVRERFDGAGLFCSLNEQTDIVPRTIPCYCLDYSDLLCTVFGFLSGLSRHHFELICSTSYGIQMSKDAALIPQSRLQESLCYEENLI